jgi:hypothetical protein
MAESTIIQSPCRNCDRQFYAEHHTDTPVVCKGHNILMKMGGCPKLMAFKESCINGLDSVGVSDPQGSYSVKIGW